MVVRGCPPTNVVIVTQLVTRQAHQRPQPAGASGKSAHEAMALFNVALVGDCGRASRSRWVVVGGAGASAV